MLRAARPTEFAWNYVDRAFRADSLPGELVIDCFAGGGGASLGIERAVGRPVDVAINHDRDAIDCHQANHAETYHLCEDVFNVHPLEATGGQSVGLAWFSPDCFPAGTMVLAREGYRPIEELKLGDEVLTHRGRWRKITKLYKTVKQTRLIRGHGHHGLEVSGEHPFLTRFRSTRWNNPIRRSEFVWHEVDWTAAKDLGKGHYWATPRQFPKAEVPPVPGRSLPIDERLLRLAGMYVGNGSGRLTKTRGEVVITCGKHAVDKFREVLDVWPRQGGRCQAGEISWYGRPTDTAYNLTANHRGLIAWLKTHFGYLAGKKRIPAWMLGIDAKLRQAFLDGYCMCDGYQGPRVTSCCSTSKALVYGIKSLATSLGYTVTTHWGNKEKKKGVIEGRVVNVNQSWDVRWRQQPHEKHKQTLVEDDFEWTPIRSNRLTGKKKTCYNLAVEEDESYIVEGLVVHNCTDFSVAKGAKPVSKNIRGLAWVVIRWATMVQPRVIMLENVREFQQWGPLYKKGKNKDRPIKSKRGLIFKIWLGRLQAQGYQVEYRVLNSADYGAPTHRKRLFLIARRDGKPIRWPEPTHGPGREHPYRTAGECIDWSRPMHSIFLTKKQAKKHKVRVIRPLAKNSLRRIGKGVDRFVLRNPNPYIVRVDHGGDWFRGQAVDKPLGVVTGGGHGYGLVSPSLVPRFGEREGQIPRTHSVHEPIPVVTPRTSGGFNLMAPAVTVYRGEQAGRSMDEPLPTITANSHHDSNPGGAAPLGILAASMTRLGQTGGGGSYSHALDEPGRTIVSKNQDMLVATHLSQYYGQSVGQEFAEPAPVVSSEIHGAVVGASLSKMYGTAIGSDLGNPAPTVLGQGNHAALLGAHLVKNYTGVVGTELHEPIGTVTSVDHHGLAAVNLVANGHGEKKWTAASEPLRTILAGGTHHAVVASHLAQSPIGGREKQVAVFLSKYYRTAIGQGLAEPIHTITPKSRFSLVGVIIDGVRYIIDDILLRMLTPRELARCQGFPDSYHLLGPDRQQVAMIGNSVSPQVPEALVRANLMDAEPCST
jgi:site-specific DNA-cytosine methylase